jgi:hypothetical protein
LRPRREQLYRRDIRRERRANLGHFAHRRRITGMLQDVLAPAVAPARKADSAVRFSPIVHVMVALGAGARAIPLLDQGGRLLRQFPTEDGYLMLTIARNMARGAGMSTADGALPTNGTQPLATLLYALCFALVGDDKTHGVAAVLALQLALASATAYAIYRLGARLFAGQVDGRARAALGAAAWYASPLVLPHTMNCLETGLYGLALVVCFSMLLTLPARTSADLSRWAAIGLALGIAFWARNDAILLSAACALVHLGWGLGARSPARPQRLLELAAAGIVMITIAAPWLAFNYVSFGSLMPISGQAEALGAKLGENLPGLLPSLLEYALLVIPIPHQLESAPWVSAVSVAVLGGLALLLRVSGPTTPRSQSALRLGLSFAALLCLFYGLFFGAGHFLSRYLFALSPLYALLWGHGVHRALATLRKSGLRPAALPIAIALALMLVVHLRAYRRGDQHQHFQVVAWVEQNVPQQAWVGAIQTGTLGFFHDRTINLDGKVNPYALEARRRGAIPEYVASSEIEYLVDWIDLLAWHEEPGIARRFEVRVAQREQNLAALHRKSAHFSARGLPR